MVPDDENEFFENGTLKQKYKDMGYPEPEKIGDSYGWTLAGHNFEEKYKENGKEKSKNYLIVKFNETEDINSALNYQKNTENTPVNYKILGPNCNTWFF